MKMVLVSISPSEFMMIAGKVFGDMARAVLVWA